MQEETRRELPVVFAIDPGRTCGWAGMYPFPGSSAGEFVGAVVTAEGPPEALYRALCSWHEDLGKHKERAVVVLEEFIPHGPLTADGVATIKVIGVVEFLCAVYGVKLVAVPPQYKLPGIAKTKVMEGLHGQRHAKDAFAHLITYLGKEHGLQGVVSLEPPGPPSG